MPYSREPIVGKTRDLIATSSEWPTSDGIGPSASSPLDLTVHSRGQDTDVQNPQVKVLLIDETNSARKIGGDGSGPVFEADGLLQCNVIAGSQDRLDAGGIDTVANAPVDVAYRMAQTVAKIWHAESPTGLTDNSGSVEYGELVPGQIRPLPDAERESNPASHGYLVELQYDYRDKTP